MKKLVFGNVYSRLPAAKDKEIFKTLFSNRKFKIERIVSKGQSTPKGKWLKERYGEWVIILKGSGKIRFQKDDFLITMKKGDYILIPRNTSHRVEWTSPREKTIWLAAHIQ